MSFELFLFVFVTLCVFAPDILVMLIGTWVILGLFGASVGIAFLSVDWLLRNVSFWEGVDYILMGLGLWLFSIIYLVALYVIPELMSALIKRTKTAYTNKFKKGN